MTLEIGHEYFWKRTGGWTWFDGRERWWEIFIEVTGFNGVGGYWLHERWRWNGSGQNLRQDIRTLSHEDSQKLTADILVAGRKEREGVE